jgi:chemotaxis protein methyltransferase CheR
MSASPLIRLTIEETRRGHEELINDVKGYDLMATIIQDLTGIHLPNNDKNRTLVAGRLSSIIQSRGLKGYTDLAAKLKSNFSKDLREEVISSITTNTTHFFREGMHYTVLKQYLNERINDRQFASDSFRVWCSACSSGQEAYSMLFTLLSSGLTQEKHRLEFLATDIDLDILKKASAGVYPVKDLETVPVEMRAAYFQPQISKQDKNYAVLPQYRKMITFARYNLIADKPAFKAGFDVIFCRNVLIYFEKDVSTAVINMLISQLKPGGVLFLGHVETGLLKNDQVQPISHAVYKKVKP